MRLAWLNITHDRARFAVTVLGITCAVFLMISQGSMLLGSFGLHQRSSFYGLDVFVF
jgi:hypothetical protein